MFEASRRAGVFSRHLSAAALAVACLLVATLALTACGAGVQAAGPAGATAAASSHAATSSAAEAWVDAAQITPTPGASESPAVTGTPEPDSTASATGDTYQAVNFTGPVEALPTSGWNGRWQVGGRAVNVSSTTVVTQQTGQVAQGAQVNVEGWQQPDGTVDAGWVTVVNPAPNGANPGNSNTGSGNTGGANAGGANTAPPVPAATGAPAPAATATPALAAQPGAANDDAENEAEHNDNEDKNDNNDKAQPNGGQTAAPGARPVEMRGYVQALPAQGFVGDWRVNGRTVHVNAHTRLNQKFGPFADGAYVQLMGWQQPDGSINAAWIQVKKAPGGNAGNGNGNGDNGNDKGNGNGKGNGDGKGNGNGKGKGGG